jgi:hypothetical protein
MRSDSLNPTSHSISVDLFIIRPVADVPDDHSAATGLSVHNVRFSSGHIGSTSLVQNASGCGPAPERPIAEMR